MLRFLHLVIETALINASQNFVILCFNGGWQSPGFCQLPDLQDTKR
jgi:hypothetical protein